MNVDAPERLDAPRALVRRVSVTVDAIHRSILGHFRVRSSDPTEVQLRRRVLGAGEEEEEEEEEDICKYVYRCHGVGEFVYIQLA